MKYPYIGKWENINTTVIFTDKNAGIEIGGEMKYRNDWTEMFYENITTEYLANTYGEVKSKEHVEFIVELAGVNKINISDVYRDSHKFFAVIDNCLLFFNHDVIPRVNGRKQINIPLPPKEYLMEFEERKGEASKDDERPKVNDDVFYKGQKWTFVAKHNDMAMLFWTGDEYCTAKISELQKPKTPEQELRDELISDFREIGQSGIVLIGMYDKVVDEFLSKYNVIKKPQ